MQTVREDIGESVNNKRRTAAIQMVYTSWLHLLSDKLNYTD